MSNDSIMTKINALLNKTVENGATEHEAASALEKAQSLMTQYMIDQSQLADHAKDRKCEHVIVDMFKTGYDTDGLNGFIGRAFDCRCWWNRHTQKVTFFGFGDDAKLAAYFYNYLNDALVNEAETYKRSAAYHEQKQMGYHPKTIMSSFRKGMIYRLIGRLEEQKEKRVSNVVKATGTDLVLVKTDKVTEEFEAMNMKFKTKRANWQIESPKAFVEGQERADNVNMSGGIGENTARTMIQKTAEAA